MTTELRHMPCNEFVEQVTAYLEGSIDPVDRARLEEHLVACSHCALYLAQLEESMRLTGRVRQDDVSAPMRGELMSIFARWRDER